MVSTYVASFPENTKMIQALIPEADVRAFMRGSGGKRALAIEAGLTQVHEAGHAVMMVVLRGFDCRGIQIGRTNRAAEMDRLTDDAAAPPDNIDIIDLAGLYAECHRMEPDTSCAWFHIKNATYDLDVARERIASTPDEEVDWAKRAGSIARETVDYFWPTIMAVAEQVPLPSGSGTLDGNRIRDLVKANLPSTDTPTHLAVRLKPLFVICPLNRASESAE